MSDQINLYTHKRKKIFNKESILHVLQFFSKVILVATILSSILLFILNSSGKLPLLEQQDRTISSNLSYVQQKIIKFLLIRERIGNIDPLLSKKSNIVTILSEISTAIPSSVSVDSFLYNQSIIQISMSSPSLESLNSFIDFAIQNVNQKHLFKKITITGLSSDNTNKYVLTMDIIYYE